MADWNDVVNDRVVMRRGRPLFYAVNILRRRREEGVMERGPGVIQFLGRGIAPGEARSDQWKRVPGGNNYNQNARGRSRSFPAPPPNIFRSQPIACHAV